MVASGAWDAYSRARNALHNERKGDAHNRGSIAKRGHQSALAKAHVRGSVRRGPIDGAIANHLQRPKHLKHRSFRFGYLVVEQWVETCKYIARSVQPLLSLTGLKAF